MEISIPRVSDAGESRRMYNFSIFIRLFISFAKRKLDILLRDAVSPRSRTCCTFLSSPSYRFSFLFTFPSIPDKHLEAFHVFELVLSSTLLLWYARRTAILRKFRDIMQIESICYVLALTCCLLLRFRTGSLRNISNIKGFPSERFASREKVIPAIFHFIWNKPREYNYQRFSFLVARCSLLQLYWTIFERFT